MAQRDREKPKRGAQRAAEPVSAMTDAVERLEARARALERERDGLRAELESARDRIRLLEESQAGAADRIEWVIDSLHNLSNKSA